ncbi:hypothetical protein B0H11DRAFT_2348152 [Mycena galericulata]|nr:hypothetical protein B0H11DRAFT_2348152 [Mycena galericulata]
MSDPFGVHFRPKVRFSANFKVNHTPPHTGWPLRPENFFTTPKIYPSRTLRSDPFGGRVAAKDRPPDHNAYELHEKKSVRNKPKSENLIGPATLAKVHTSPRNPSVLTWSQEWLEGMSESPRRIRPALPDGCLCDASSIITKQFHNLQLVVVLSRALSSKFPGTCEIRMQNHGSKRFSEPNESDKIILARDKASFRGNLARFGKEVFPDARSFSRDSLFHTSCALQVNYGCIQRSAFRFEGANAGVVKSGSRRCLHAASVRKFAGPDISRIAQRSSSLEKSATLYRMARSHANIGDIFGPLEHNHRTKVLFVKIDGSNKAEKGPKRTQAHKVTNLCLDRHKVDGSIPFGGINSNYHYVRVWGSPEKFYGASYKHPSDV